MDLGAPVGVARGWFAVSNANALNMRWLQLDSTIPTPFLSYSGAGGSNDQPTFT